jgi:hypothetical protein
MNAAFGDRRRLIGLVCLACISELVYLAVVFSSQSLHETGTGSHSLLTLLALFAAAFGAYLIAIRIASRAQEDGRLVVLIVGTGVLFRLTLLVSDPIEEIDLYRYLWDGSVVTQGVSPFRYTPQQVLAASVDDDLPEDLARLVRLRDSSPEMTAILKKIHFGELPTIYPPVGQAIFALCAWTTPADASLFIRMTLMRAWFVAFDLGTLGLVIVLLRIAGQPLGLSLIYGWCPLVLKEVANSGHLDSLAYFLATLSLVLTVGVAYQTPAKARSSALWMSASASAALALACGAKLYPVIFLPLLVVAFHKWHGWKCVIVACTAFAATIVPLAWPMLPDRNDLAASETLEFNSAQVIPLPDDSPPVPPQQVGTAARDPSQSLRAFLSEWEMNDFLFLILIENLRPTTDLSRNEVAWFSVVPERSRLGLIHLTETWLGIAPSRAPFLLTRGIMSVAFVIVAGWLAWRARTLGDPTDWLATAFLTVAWFWLLLPTLNPWYWTWAIPLLPFARGRAWLLMSGLVFLYYFRFWLMHHAPDTPLLGTRYNGPLFFDYVVVWLEFFPWFVVLTAGSLLRSPVGRQSTAYPM